MCSVTAFGPYLTKFRDWQWIHNFVQKFSTKLHFWVGLARSICFVANCLVAKALSWRVCISARAKMEQFLSLNHYLYHVSHNNFQFPLMNSSACCDLFSLEIGLIFCFNACAEIDSKLLRNQNLKKRHSLNFFSIPTLRFHSSVGGSTQRVSRRNEFKPWQSPSSLTGLNSLLLPTVTAVTLKEHLVTCHSEVK